MSVIDRHQTIISHMETLLLETFTKWSQSLLYAATMKATLNTWTSGSCAQVGRWLELIKLNTFSYLLWLFEVLTRFLLVFRTVQLTSQKEEILIKISSALCSFVIVPHAKNTLFYDEPFNAHFHGQFHWQWYHMIINNQANQSNFPFISRMKEECKIGNFITTHKMHYIKEYLNVD